MWTFFPIVRRRRGTPSYVELIKVESFIYPRVYLPKFSCGFTKVLVWICRNPHVDYFKTSREQTGSKVWMTSTHFEKTFPKSAPLLRLLFLTRRRNSHLLLLLPLIFPLKLFALLLFPTWMITIWRQKCGLRIDFHYIKPKKTNNLGLWCGV